MKKKKVVALTLVMTMGLGSVLSGCGAKGSPTASGDKKNTDTSKEDVVTITYGGWENPIFIEEMAEKFNERHPNIKVDVIDTTEVGGTFGNEKLSELAATGDMPDIINVESLEVPIQNGWLTDLTPYYEKDKDASQLPENFVQYGTVNDQLVMLPSAMYLFGIMINKDLLSANGIPIPEYNWTVDEYVDIVKKTTKAGSTIGTNGVEDLMKHFPAQMNPDLGWGSFNETEKKYNLGEEWQESVNIVKDLLDSGVSFYEAIDGIGIPWDHEENSPEYKEIDEKRAQYMQDLVGETVADAIWQKGKAATWAEFSWTMGFDENENYSGFDWDYYPVPTAEGKEPRTAFVVDSIAVTSSCKHPEEAYEFLKYLSFAKEGIEDRMEVVESYDKEALKEKYPDYPESEFAVPFQYTQMPVTTDKEVIKQWAEFNDVKPGVSYMLERLETGYCDGYKVTPGFDEAYLQTIVGAVKDQIFTGQKTPADMAGELEQKANEITDKAYAELNK